jgi:hypothetical protein
MATGNGPVSPDVAGLRPTHPATGGASPWPRGSSLPWR